MWFFVDVRFISQFSSQHEHLQVKLCEHQYVDLEDQSWHLTPLEGSSDVMTDLHLEEGEPSVTGCRQPDSRSYLRWSPGAQLSTRAPRALPSLQSWLKFVMGRSGTLCWIQPRRRCLGVFDSAWSEEQAQVHSEVFPLDRRTSVRSDEAVTSSSSPSHMGMEME